jgi:hypothetical protein
MYRLTLKNDFINQLKHVTKRDKRSTGTKKFVLVSDLVLKLMRVKAKLTHEIWLRQAYISDRRYHPPSDLRPIPYSEEIVEYLWLQDITVVRPRIEHTESSKLPSLELRNRTNLQFKKKTKFRTHS